MSVVKSAGRGVAKRRGVSVAARLGVGVRERRALAASAGVRAGPLDQLSGVDVMARIRLVRAGVPSRRVQDVADALGWSKERLYDALGIARATVDRKIREDRPLSASEGERLLGLAQLLRHAARLYEESGDPDAVAHDDPAFDPARWLGEWLAEPNPALGGEHPAALLDTADGRELVGRLLESMRAGTYW